MAQDDIIAIMLWRTAMSRRRHLTRSWRSPRTSNPRSGFDRGCGLWPSPGYRIILIKLIA